MHAIGNYARVPAAFDPSIGMLGKTGDKVEFPCPEAFTTCRDSRWSRPRPACLKRLGRGLGPETLKNIMKPKLGQSSNSLSNIEVNSLSTRDVLLFQYATAGLWPLQDGTHVAEPSRPCTL